MWLDDERSEKGKLVRLPPKRGGVKSKIAVDLVKKITTILQCGKYREGESRSSAVFPASSSASCNSDGRSSNLGNILLEDC